MLYKQIKINNNYRSHKRHYTITTSHIYINTVQKINYYIDKITMYTIFFIYLYI